MEVILIYIGRLCPAVVNKFFVCAAEETKHVAGTHNSYEY